jgi:outer membrane protein OmpA-like peptidoglycan-associated protein
MKTIEKIIESLKKAALELEKLQVQAALGKAEAKDKYEQARKEFRIKLEEIKRLAKGKYAALKPILESFEVQFALGKMEAKEKFEESIKKFSQAIKKVESFLKQL